MNYRKFRNAWKASLGIGMAFLIAGVWLFGNSSVGTHEEKFGVILMAYSGIFLGIAFTIYVTLKANE